MTKSAKQKQKERRENRNGPKMSTCSNCGAEFMCWAENRDAMDGCFCHSYPVHVGENDSCNHICEPCLQKMCAHDPYNGKKG